MQIPAIATVFLRLPSRKASAISASVLPTARTRDLRRVTRIPTARNLGSRGTGRILDVRHVSLLQHFPR